MRLSEVIIIYLAAGAPYGAHHFLKYGRTPRRALTLLKAAGAMLSWPLALCLKLTARRAAGAALAEEAQEDEATARALEKVSRAKERLLVALYRIQELAREDAEACAGLRLERETRAIVESIEKYVGLTLAVSAIDLDGPLDERELELCRLAGRTGEDLLLAGRCIRRRNAAQLLSHQARSRNELLHALAEVREFRVEAHGAPRAERLKALYLSAAVLKFYGHAINLLSLLEDEGAAKSLARLLNAECARLRRLESDYLPDAAETAAEGEVCTTRPLSQRATQPLSPETRTALRG